MSVTVLLSLLQAHKPAGVSSAVKTEALLTAAFYCVHCLRSSCHPGKDRTETKMTDQKTVKIMKVMK